MFYLIYKITNTINGKIYIGAHATKDKNDSYMGSGSIIKKAIKKYGRKNFVKEIIHSFTDSISMYTMESILVNEEFVNDPKTYNAKIGGYGGWSHYNGTEKHIETTRKTGLDLNRKYQKWFSEQKQQNTTWYQNFCKQQCSKLKPRNWTKDERQALSTKMKGNGNHNFGKRWIVNLISGEIKQILSEELENFLENNDNWRIGKIQKKCRNMFWINNSSVNKYIKSEELDKYLTDGWNRGRIQPLKKWL